MYNDLGVLENHHAATAFQIAKRKDCNIFQGLEKEQYRELRKMIVAMVLATDMSNHL